MTGDGIIGKSVRIASGYVQRLRGLLFQRSFDGVLVIVPCKAIHTWGMSCAIDVAFVDKHGYVVKVCRRLAPRQYRACSRACLVLERFVCDTAWFREGDYVALSVMKGRQQ